VSPARHYSRRSNGHHTFYQSRTRYVFSAGARKKHFHPVNPFLTSLIWLTWNSLCDSVSREATRTTRNRPCQLPYIKDIPELGKSCCTHSSVLGGLLVLVMTHGLYFDLIIGFMHFMRSELEVTVRMAGLVSSRITCPPRVLLMTRTFTDILHHHASNQP
jgi:hypothetical protein